MKIKIDYSALMRTVPMRYSGSYYNKGMFVRDSSSVIDLELSPDFNEVVHQILLKLTLVRVPT